MSNEPSGLPEGVTADQIEQYRKSLTGMAPQTVWHTLNRATVIEPGQVPSGFEWRIPIMRMHLILVEYRGHRFLEDPATMGTEGDERIRWKAHSARRFDQPSVDLREALGREHFGDFEYESMRDEKRLPGGLA